MKEVKQAAQPEVDGDLSLPSLMLTLQQVKKPAAKVRRERERERERERTCADEERRSRRLRCLRMLLGAPPPLPGPGARYEGGREEGERRGE